MPERCIGEIESAVDFYSDLFVQLVNICKGKVSFEEAKRFIDIMWED